MTKSRKNSGKLSGASFCARPAAVMLLCVGVGLSWLALHGQAAAAVAPRSMMVAQASGKAQPDSGSLDVSPAAVEAPQLPKVAPKAESVVTTGPQQAVPEGNVGLDQLLRLWGVFGDRGDARCRGLQIGNLRCLSARGTLETLARFNRPAILTLKVDGRRQRVLLTTLTDTEAMLVGANGARRISRTQLARLWTGQFQMVWRTNIGADLVYRGMKGQAITWLTRRIARAAGDESDDKSSDKDGDKQEDIASVFDSAVESQVRNFQLMHGLKPDGLVGPRTQIMLNGVVPQDGVPTLAAAPKKKG